MSKHPTSELVGLNLKRFREARGLSTEEVAAHLSRKLGKDVQPYIVNRMEKGARPITVDELEALASLLSMSNRDRFFVQDRDEQAYLPVIAGLRYEALQRLNDAISAVASFLDARSNLEAHIRFAEEDGVALTGNEGYFFQEYGADELWHLAERKDLIDHAGNFEIDDLIRELEGLKDESAT